MKKLEILVEQPVSLNIWEVFTVNIPARVLEELRRVLR